MRSPAAVDESEAWTNVNVARLSGFVIEASGVRGNTNHNTLLKISDLLDDFLSSQASSNPLFEKFEEIFFGYKFHFKTIE